MSEHRICVEVDDLDRAVAFYGTALGLAVARRYGADWVELLGGPAPIDLLARRPGLSWRRRHDSPWTPVHLDLVVPDLDVALVRAARAGARLERRVEERSWGRMANLSDPFGHGLCLVEFRAAAHCSAALS